ncbi:MAG: DNA-protecting protein DprA [Acidobacteria bacterium]|nr:DNA-protecting protein DprA [Acidobacteriota bacterium]
MEVPSTEHRILRPRDPDYPDLLRAIRDVPETLYVAGCVEQTPRVALVGSRACTRYGREVAYELAAALARRGVSVVSGLARGIDAAAHEGALSVDGHTVAVLPGGVDPVYPARHRSLSVRIRRRGALVAERELGSGIAPWHFPRRNRIIAGLSEVIVVVEAAARSGARITADLGLAEGRDVLVVPGPITSRTSVGCHQLIAAGAFPITGVDDILDHLGETLVPPDSRASTSPPEAEELAPSERQLFDALATGDARSLDELAVTLDLPVGVLLVAATGLEIRGLALLLPGNRIEARHGHDGRWPE